MTRRYTWVAGEGWVERERRPEPQQHIIRDQIDGSRAKLPILRRRFVWFPDSGVTEVPADYAPEPRQHIIRDHIDGFVSQADGREYDSKSQYRRALKAQGFVEMGNDRPNPQPYRPLPDWDRAIHEAMAQRGL